MSKRLVVGTLAVITLLVNPVTQAKPKLKLIQGRPIVTIGGIPQDVSTLTITPTNNVLIRPSGSIGTISPFSLANQNNQLTFQPQNAGGIQLGPGSFSVGDNNSLDFTAVGQFSVNQMVPPAPANYVPASTSTTQKPVSVAAQNTGESVIQLEIAAERPDFRYSSGRLEFQQESTHTTGQSGMAIGPGIPQGTVRYVPAGEF